MMKPFLTLLILTLSVCVSYGAGNNPQELSIEKAIQVATEAAKNQGFNTQKTDIEILKVKKGLERGPLRIVSLIRMFPKNMSETIVKKEFWVILFYPEGQMEGASILGGDFTALIDLYSGEVLGTFSGM